MCRLAILLGIFLQAALAPAAGTRSWETASYGDFLGGTFRNMALDSEGSLRVAPSLDEVHASDQAVVWAIAGAGDGTIFYGTGHQGAVFAVPPGGSGELLWSAPEIEVFALAVSAGGDLYAGTSPDGKVYRIGRDGNGILFFDPGEKYIWSLVFDSEGHLVVGTGDGGKIYRVAPDGSGGVWFETGQRHVISLALDSGGAVLAGTDPEGILYRVQDGRGFAVYDSDLPEVRSISLSQAGEVYFAAMGGGMDRLLQAIPAQPAAVQVQAGGAAVQASAPQVASTVTYGQPQVVYSGERAALMRLVPDRAIEKIWSSNEENILGIATRKAGDEHEVLFATDSEGRVYRSDHRRRLSLLAQTGKAQMTTMLRAGDGVLVGSAHGGTLYRLGDRAADEGVFESAPRDTSGVSQWGNLTWKGEAPEGSAIEISTRSGNTYRPDRSWSEWSPPLAAGSRVSSPPGRFLQWRATLRGSARLDALRVHYLPQNSAPVVRSLNVVPEAPKAAGSGEASQSNASSSYSITVSASGNSSQPKPAGGSAASDAVTRKLAIVWSAEDPDGDELRAEISFRGEGETAWKKIRDDLPGPRFSIDSDALADGRYEFRVRVDDGKANTAERALQADRISRPVLVDRTPPRVEPAEPAEDGGLRFSAVDAASEIVHAEYSVDAGPWQPVLSDDGMLDAPGEDFTVRPEGLSPGEHLVVLRVRDRSGNVALAKSLLR